MIVSPRASRAPASCGLTDESCFSPQSLANLVTDEHLAEGRLYPPLSMIQDVSLAIAVNLAEYVYKEGMASAYPEPDDKEAFIRSFLYDVTYESFEPVTWEWPDD